MLLDAVIVMLALVVSYFAYDAFISQQFAGPPPSPPPPPVVGKAIQVDVLNGCGVKNVASRIRDYLLKQGIDVVEMKNYKTFDVGETLVIDRVGNLELAQHVGRILGIQDQNIIQELNPDYFVQVSVVIGKDYSNLKPMK